ncbi:hypothetical protein [Ferrovum sp.]|uniref:hypothetical protein n=1 Tax=Ferrovum sp. TaxID=2609467 RepID=UPI002619EBB1|nr:hypothetical protein [Ferrovum sp.]
MSFESGFDGICPALTLALTLLILTLLILTLLILTLLLLLKQVKNLLGCRNRPYVARKANSRPSALQGNPGHFPAQVLPKHREGQFLKRGRVKILTQILSNMRQQEAR